ncbi:hypothetical protein [Roseateles sp. P5_E11]
MNDSDPLVYLLESSDQNLAGEVERSFAHDDVSVSSNFIGGAEIAIFFALALRPIRDVIKEILAFQKEKVGRYQRSKIVIGEKKIELTGYGPDDLSKIYELLSSNQDQPESR